MSHRFYKGTPRVPLRSFPSLVLLVAAVGLMILPFDAGPGAALLRLGVALGLGMAAVGWLAAIRGR